MDARMEPFLLTFAIRRPFRNDFFQKRPHVTKPYYLLYFKLILLSPRAPRASTLVAKVASKGMQKRWPEIGFQKITQSARTGAKKAESKVVPLDLKVDFWRPLSPTMLRGTPPGHNPSQNLRISLNRPPKTSEFHEICLRNGAQKGAMSAMSPEPPRKKSR